MQTIERVSLHVEEYVVMGKVNKRRVLVSLRCGCLPLHVSRIQTWQNPTFYKVPLEDRIVDTTHFLITCMHVPILTIFDESECINYISPPLLFLQKCLFTLSYPSKQITNLIYDTFKALCQCQKSNELPSTIIFFCNVTYKPKTGWAILTIIL